jgi:major membrane immunogen (membrane-anchored lipoprotein)
MMIKTAFTLVLFLLLSFSTGQSRKDGLYIGITRSVYIDEPYYAHSEIKVEKGKIVAIKFFVRDSAKHVCFDDKYEKYFAGNDLYIQQCRSDWKGIQSYPDTLLKYQDLDKVDVISGATWSYNMFMDSVREALSSAENSE